MAFNYYKRLTPGDQRVYRQSDRVSNIVLPDPDSLAAELPALAEALTGEDRARTTAVTQALLVALTTRLRVPPVRVAVLETRPSSHWGELQGLYTPRDGPQRRFPRMTLWMRTAKRRRVVAFRTYLRTMLHELCHHLDYELLHLRDSFHTEGFYKRESSLFHQLMQDRARARRAGGGGAESGPRATRVRVHDRP